MKGNNKLNLNKATMIEALQEYFDKRYTPNIKVTNIEFNSGDNAFVCQVEDIKEND